MTSDIVRVIDLLKRKGHPTTRGAHHIAQQIGSVVFFLQQPGVPTMSYNKFLPIFTISTKYHRKRKYQNFSPNFTILTKYHRKRKYHIFLPNFTIFINSHNFHQFSQFSPIFTIFTKYCKNSKYDYFHKCSQFQFFCC